MNRKEFFQPPNAYRPAPFWSVNDRLEAAELQRQVREFARVGYGGWFFHARVGIATRYLSDAWMDAFQAALEEGKRRRMLCWIYDEDSYPSGFAAGLVLRKHPEFRGCALRMVGGAPPANSTIAARFAIRRSENRLVAMRRLEPGLSPAPGEAELAFIIEPYGNAGWFNGGGYTDMLNPDAVDAFIAITHEAYAQRFGHEFGKSIPGVFTDEPHIAPFAPGPCLVWSSGFEKIFAEEHGYSILDHLPELFLDGPNSGRVRIDYRLTVARRFQQACIGRMAEWCARRRLVLTGHCWEHEFPRIDHAGTFNYAEIPMQWPGIDLLGANFPKGRLPGRVQKQVGRITVVKSISGLAHQFGRTRIMSETYGGGGWEMTFRDLKEILDWECVLGVNYVVPHLSHYSLRGCRKRDYPPAFLDYAPWWPELRLLNDYSARLCYALSSGKPKVDIAVLEPLADAWNTPPHDRAAEAALERMGKLVDSLLKHLAEAQWEFDLVDELTLAEYGRAESAKPANTAVLGVGQALYRVLIVPPVKTLYSGALAVIEAFVHGGGRVLFAGPPPEAVDGAPSARLDDLLSRPGVEIIPPAREALTRALSPMLHPHLTAASAEAANPLPIYVHTRVLEDGEAIFWVNTADAAGEVEFLYPSPARVEVWDLLTGEVRESPCEVRNGQTRWRRSVAPGESELLRFHPLSAPPPARPPKIPRTMARGTAAEPLSGPWEYELLDDNALLFERFEYRIGNGEWSPPRRIWQVLKELREHFGVEGEPDLRNNRARRFYDIWNAPNEFGAIALRCHAEFAAAPGQLGGPIRFMVESGERFELFVNGEKVQGPSGAWRTPAFTTFDVTDRLRRGDNVFELRTRFSEDSELEPCYLLGRFGVWRRGRRFAVGAMPANLTTGDWASQGLPFFGGRLRIRRNVRAPAGRGAVVLTAETLSCPVARVEVDGAEAGHFLWPPYRVTIPNLEPAREASLTIECAGSLRNTFGPWRRNVEWNDFPITGPQHWMEDSGFWSDEWHFHPEGIPGGLRLERLDG